MRNVRLYDKRCDKHSAANERASTSDRADWRRLWSTMSSTPITAEPRNAVLFKEWLVSHGGSFHPGVRYSSVPSGLSIQSSEAIAPDATIVTCPFSIIITPLSCRGALLPILKDASGTASMLERWTERQSIIVYLCLHWILISGPDGTYDGLIHAPYLDTLPSPSQLRTPLHFTGEELSALRGTNLYGATIDRRQVWEAEWEQCCADVSAVNAEWGKELTWERFLTAATYLSSRAFPSTLLSSSSPSLVQQPDSYPVLIPGVDALNHARAQPVSWVVNHHHPPSSSSSSTTATDDGRGSSISLVTHSALNAGAEIFNNYGAKPNSELLLGYGFTLPDNPDDTIVLKIGGTGTGTAGGGDTAAQQQQQHEVGRSARGAASVWGAIINAEMPQEQEQEGEEVPVWQIILDSADALRSMTKSLLSRLPSFVPEPEHGTRREDVMAMIGHYVSGQREVLQELSQYGDDREADGVLMARREGVLIQLEGDGDDHQG
ncbi:hypothetical protein BJV74DRAFT_851425 [Russula compacta]|nr:hypothetical protein BJV74DRAFT_851425 [Russula compacta]